MDSLWVNSQPFIMMVRWTVGSPNSAGYFTKSGSTITGFKPGAEVDPLNPVVTNTAGRKLMYRVSCDKSEPFGLDRGTTVAQWYVGPRKWLDINRGKGTDPNGSGAIDFPIFRLAETYLNFAEASYGDRTAARPEWDDMACTKRPALLLGYLYDGRHNPGPARGNQGLSTCS